MGLEKAAVISRKKSAKKKLCVVVGIIVVLILMSIPLYITNPTLEDYQAKLPTEFVNADFSKQSIVHKDYKIISCYIETKQISSANVQRYAYLGIAGKILPAENGITKFIANSLTWMEKLLQGTTITIALTLASVTTGIILSIFLALGKMSKRKIISGFCKAYIFFFRGTPLLMQLYFIWFGLPKLCDSFTITSRFMAAYIAFSLNSGAYCAEIIRAAIQSIDKGQFEAAKVLGLSYAKTMRKIIIPQTYRRLIPPLANEFIMVLKDASLTSIIALQDLSKATSAIMTSTGEVSVFIISMGIYLIITALFSKLFVVLEKKFGVYE